jgi:hypothetical protein
MMTNVNPTCSDLIKSQLLLDYITRSRREFRENDVTVLLTLPENLLGFVATRLWPSSR